MAEQIEVKLYAYDRLSMRNKKKVTWFRSHIGYTQKPIKIFSRLAGQIEGKRHTNAPQATGVQVCEGIIDRSHGLTVILD